MSKSSRENVVEPAGWERAALLGGVLFVTLVAAAMFAAPALADPDAPLDEYAAAYAEHQSGHLLSTFLSGLSAIAFMFFIGGLYAVLRKAESGVGQLSQLGFGGALVSITLVTLGQGVYAATALAAAVDGMEPAVIRGMDNIVPTFTMFSLAPLAVFLGTTSAVILRFDAAPRWLGWSALLVAILSLVGFGGVLDPESLLGFISFISVIFFSIWVMATSIVLYRRAPARLPAAQAAAA